MITPVPRILTVAVQHPSHLFVSFDAAPKVVLSINLAGWIRRGGDPFSALLDPDVFGSATIGAHGGNVTWDDDEGELAIDSVHLEALAAEQHPFTGSDARDWQQMLGLSDSEAADVLGLDGSAWRSMKESRDALPAATARLCRAALRDPFIAEAHLKAAPRDEAA